MTWYMMPEILIICFLQLHNIKLKLLGLYYDIENDVEGVMEGIDRNLEKGNLEVLK